MSHFSVTIIGENPEEQLAPYQETGDYNDEEMRPYLQFKDDSEYKREYEENKIIKYGEDNGRTLKEVYPTYENFLADWAGLVIDAHTGKHGYWFNPNAKWDWYVVGGRWSGYFKLKGKDKFVDQAKKGKIDFEGIGEKAALEAKERYELLEKILGGIPTLTYLWEDFIREGGVYSHLDIATKRNMYNNQPAMLKIKEHIDNLDLLQEERDFLVWLDIDSYQVSKEEYTSVYRKKALSTFAVLKEGKWYTKGDMGWWGHVTNEKDPSTWEEEFNKLINDLPEDTLLTLVDCHI